MLTRKPKAGEIVVFTCPNSGEVTRYTVDHLRGSGDRIMVLRYPDGRTNEAIWGFPEPDGLVFNANFSHDERSGKAM